MMTIVTHVTLKKGTEPEWDAAMRERLVAAREARCSAMRRRAFASAAATRARAASRAAAIFSSAAAWIAAMRGLFARSIGGRRRGGGIGVLLQVLTRRDDALDVLRRAVARG